MLILGRRANQSIVFPHCGITVRILGVNGRVAKIGIDAPREVQVMRGELAHAAVTTGSGNDGGIIDGDEFPTNVEQQIAPEDCNGGIQFEQRLSHIKESLHIFQQLRAMGDESQADNVLADLLQEIAHLDRDWLENEDSQSDTRRGIVSRSQTGEAGQIAEPATSYHVNSDCVEPKYILIVNERQNKPDILFAGEFPNCQVCTVNSTQLAKQAIEASEDIDCLVCNCDEDGGENEKLVQALRSNSHYQSTKVLVVDDSKSTLEQFQSSTNSGIDGWLSRPLSPKDLWCHLAESVVFEI